jgi:23S rRNA pseudouridine2605 synthase
MRLNKYIAHAGVCSRRDADQVIADGKVTVNGKVVTEMGHKVSIGDLIVVDKVTLKLEPHVYILLNKGRDTISTTSDERGRATVIDAIEDATGYRVYPVGRLDRNTTGLLMLTNDGDLAHRLMHPSHKVGKTYEALTDRPLSDEDLQQLRLGVMLEDGPAKATTVKRKEGDPFTLRLTVQEGRNHLVRRMIAHLGSEVVRLKRTTFGGLNDRDLRLGRWRYLRDEEVEALRRLVKGVPGPEKPSEPTQKPKMATKPAPAEERQSPKIRRR